VHWYVKNIEVVQQMKELTQDQEGPVSEKKDDWSPKLQSTPFVGRLVWKTSEREVTESELFYATMPFQQPSRPTGGRARVTDEGRTGVL
jgi:hypothetical protein